MTNLKGVFKAQKKDGSIYYRSSITHKSKHISLGSYAEAPLAHCAYLEASRLLTDFTLTIDTYIPSFLSNDKTVILLNFRDNGLYFGTPIYLYKRFFHYYINKSFVLTFDIDDLFYYSSRKIMIRGGHYFVSDYGMQVNILNRYGIRNYAVKGRDYHFKNDNETDFRYENIVIINRYYGVSKVTKKNQVRYKVKIHINGDYQVGTYKSEETAAIAYNKAVDILKKRGLNKAFPINFIETFSALQYAEIYSNIKISNKIINYTPK